MCTYKNKTKKRTRQVWARCIPRRYYTRCGGVPVRYDYSRDKSTSRKRPIVLVWNPRDNFTINTLALTTRVCVYECTARHGTVYTLHRYGVQYNTHSPLLLHRRTDYTDEVVVRCPIGKCRWSSRANTTWTDESDTPNVRKSSESFCAPKQNCQYGNESMFQNLLLSWAAWT